MPRLRNRAVLDAGLTGPQLLWEQEGFALADDYDPATGIYRALVLPTDHMSVAVTDATLIVQPEWAMAQRARELPVDEVSAVEGHTAPDSRGGRCCAAAGHDMLLR